MPPAALNAPYLHVPGTQAPLISAAIFSSAAAVGPTMIDHAGQSFDEMWAGFSDWLVEPHVWPLFLSFTITFAAASIVLPALRRESRGVVAGTVAALVQTVAYVAFTPVGALLSTIGSMAVTGYLNPLLTDLALLLGAAVTLVLWPFLSGVVA